MTEKFSRNSEIEKMSSDGISISEIGRYFSISSTRVRQILNNAKNKVSEFDNLSTRTINALKGIGIHNMDKLMLANIDNIKSAYGLGSKGVFEIKRLLEDSK